MNTCFIHLKEHSFLQVLASLYPPCNQGHQFMQCVCVCVCVVYGLHVVWHSRQIPMIIWRPRVCLEIEHRGLCYRAAVHIFCVCMHTCMSVYALEKVGWCMWELCW